jgi:hypothetical protein
VVGIAACSKQNIATEHAHLHANTPLVKYAGLSAPVSVLYDVDRDRYLVSNVNGDALAHDDNGFISVLSPEGEIASERWIESGKRGVHLDAPKGLTIANGILYVTDISVVRTFDAASGEPRGDIAVPGSTYLKDLTTAPDGKVYLTDAGAPLGRWDGKGTEAIYVLEGGKARALARGLLGRPDGLAWSDRGLVVAPFGASEIYRLDANGKKQDVTKTPAGGLSGIVRLADGSFLVTSFQASSIFHGKLGGSFEVAFAGQSTPADIGYDTKRSRLLVPHYGDGTVEAFEIE